MNQFIGLTELKTEVNIIRTTGSISTLIQPNTHTSPLTTEENWKAT